MGNFAANGVAGFPDPHTTLGSVDFGTGPCTTRQAINFHLPALLKSREEGDISKYQHFESTMRRKKHCTEIGAGDENRTRASSVEGRGSYLIYSIVFNAFREIF